MDDVYQYAPSAAVSDNNSEQPKEDAISRALTNFSFSQSWNSLVDTVKKQSEEVVNVTKRDLQEFASVVRHDTIDRFSRNVASSNEEQREEETPAQRHWSDYIPLPDSDRLARIQHEMDQGTKVAEQYMQKFGSEVLQVLNKTLTIIEPEEEVEQEQQQRWEASNETSAKPKRIFASRKEALMAEMIENPDTFLKDPGHLEDDIEKRTDEIAGLLETYPELREMMDRLVPVQVSYIDFWKRYFYHAREIELNEERRRLILKDAQETDEGDDFKWDSDEEVEDEKSTTQAKAPSNSAHSGNETS